MSENFVIDTITGTDPSFTFGGKRNRNKQGSLIPSHFGVVRNWPEFASAPFTTYGGASETFQYDNNLFCLGYGNYEVLSLFHDKHNLNTDTEYSYEVVPPGGDVTLFDPNVINANWRFPIAVKQTSSSQPNTDFDRPLTPPGLYVNKMSLDFFFPDGITGFSGATARFQKIKFYASYKEIDNEGNDVPGAITRNIAPEITDFVFVTSPVIISWEFNLVNNEGGSDPARYRLSINEIEYIPQILPIDSDLNKSQRVIGARGVNTNSTTNQFDGITLLAVQREYSYLDSNSLDHSDPLFNVYQQRILPVYNEATELWENPIGTRNPMDAVFEIFRSSNGGSYSDTFFDFETLLALRQQFTNDGAFFDHSFRSGTTVWEAASLALSSGRATPALIGSTLTAVRDTANNEIKKLFTPENIISGSLDLSHEYVKENDPDGLIVEFIDKDTWSLGYLLCKDDDEDGLQPSIERLRGITDPTLALREGYYRRAKTIYENQKLVFETGLEGYLLNIDDMIAVSSDLNPLSQNGRIESKDGMNLVLKSEEGVIMDPEEDYEILIQEKSGSVLGPLPVETGEGYVEVVKIEAAVPPDSDFVIPSNSEPLVYIFGPVGNGYNKFKVLEIEPEGLDSVLVTCRNVSDKIYEKDTEIADSSLYVNQIVNNYKIRETGETDTIVLSWDYVADSERYRIYTSYDNETWTEVYSETDPLLNEVELVLTAGIVYFRGEVRIDGAYGPYTYYAAIVGYNLPPEPVTSAYISSPFVVDEFTLRWDLVDRALSYRIRIYNSALTLIDTKEIFPGAENFLTYTYTKALATADFGVDISRDFVIEIRSKNDNGTTLSGLYFYMEKKLVSSPRGIGFELTHDGGTDYTLEIECDEDYVGDVEEFKFYADIDPEFVPGAGNEVTDGNGTYSLDGASTDILKILTCSIADQVTANSDLWGKPVSIYIEVSSIDLWDGTEVFGARFSQETEAIYIA